MLSLYVILFGAIVVWSLIQWLYGDRTERPPATRAELDRAERDNKPDITTALDRTEPRRRSPSLLVVVVQQPSPSDDPRRWN